MSVLTVINYETLNRTLCRSERPSATAYDADNLCRERGSDILDRYRYDQFSSSRLRIGKGYYKWIFEQQDDVNTQVAAMHIHIERMDAIEDAEGRLLTIAQSVLPYPRLFPAVLRSAFELLAEAGPAFAFLDAFKMPFDPAV